MSAFAARASANVGARLELHRPGHVAASGMSWPGSWRGVMKINSHHAGVKLLAGISCSGEAALVK